ncbi:Reverse transcriptase domain, partial [Trinorchestia longiramus]
MRAWIFCGWICCLDQAIQKPQVLDHPALPAAAFGGRQRVFLRFFGLDYHSWFHFSKAFDTVPQPQLISQISSLPLNHHIVRWLVCYLKGRSAKCSYQHHLSSSRPVLAGVPQGSVISPAIFNLFVSDYPPTAPLITSYADDFTAVATTTKIPDASAILSAHSADVITWAQQKGLTVSIAKSQSSVFTPDTHQSHTNPHVTCEGTDLTHCRSPKILGITFDPHFTCTPHINSICERARHRLNILKALAGSSWGQ